MCKFRDTNGNGMRTDTAGGGRHTEGRRALQRAVGRDRERKARWELRGRGSGAEGTVGERNNNHNNNNNNNNKDRNTERNKKNEGHHSGEKKRKMSQEEDAWTIDT